MSSKPRKQYFIATPIYYVNDKPHIGHCYTTMLADAAARYHRFAGRDVFFLTGTDEHSERVARAGHKRGLSPMEWATQNATAFQDAFRELRFTNDDFIRTTEPRHIDRVVACVQQLLDQGDIYEGDYEGWWDATQEEYVTENTAREHEYKSPVTGKPLVKHTEKNDFFRLSDYSDRLLKHINDNPGFIKPEARRNEVLGRIKQGLQDVPVSRADTPGDPAAGWGIPMPNGSGRRIYVWIDALLNYYTANEDRKERTGVDHWPPSVNLVGKDILWFHAVIWPCLLMALDKPLPDCVYAHSYWIREGRKMSKSLGNFLDLPTLRGYIKRYGLDAMRWYLLTQGPLGATDADFAHSKFIEVYNAHLANGIGNAFSRVSNMIGKYFEGNIPAPCDGALNSEDFDWPEISSQHVKMACDAARAFDFPNVFHIGSTLSRTVDGFIHKTEPFKLAKDPSRLNEVGDILYHCAEALRIA